MVAYSNVLTNSWFQCAGRPRGRPGGRPTGCPATLADVRADVRLDVYQITSEVKFCDFDHFQFKLQSSILTQ